MQRFFLILFSLLSFFSLKTYCQDNYQRPIFKSDDAIPGAFRLDLYLNDINGKNIGIVANQTSIVHNTHLIDTLLSHNITIKKIFTPEHGFRGSADEGAMIDNSIDEKTQIPIISLYGNNKKPESTQLQDIDILLFDLQDIGARFYTYISTMTYIMEAAAENDIPVIVLDRPNPNCFYVDGPVMLKDNTSFVGLHQIPVVYGMTIGEYALMVNGEYWLKDSIQCNLKVIPLGNYDRNAIYKLAIKPSPNLPNWESVFLYPSLCFFEGTVVSVGRGTEIPFQVYGHPSLDDDFMFIPKKAEGRRAPLFCDQICHGKNLIEYAHQNFNNNGEINLEWLIDAYSRMNKENFFNNYFIKLSGTDELRQQIEQGLSNDDIRATWRDELNNFKEIRKKYLIYDDIKTKEQ